MLKYSLITLLLFFSLLGFSQEDGYVAGDNTSSSSSSDSSNDKGFDWDRVTIGGGLGLSFGTITVIEVAPNIGYYLTENIIAGIGGRYSYYKDNVYNYSTSIYGGRVYGQYLFNNMPLLAHVEVEYVNLEWVQNERINMTNLYVGGGFKQSLGGGSYLSILGLWNLNETKESYVLQPNPVIRVGFAIGL